MKWGPTFQVLEDYSMEQEKFGDFDLNLPFMEGVEEDVDLIKSLVKTNVFQNELTVQSFIVSLETSEKRLCKKICFA